MDLSGHGDLLIGLVSKRTLAAVGIVKCDGDSGSCDSSLATFVHQVLQVPCPHLEKSTRYVGERERNIGCMIR